MNAEDSYSTSLRLSGEAKMLLEELSKIFNLPKTSALEVAIRKWARMENVTISEETRAAFQARLSETQSASTRQKDFTSERPQTARLSINKSPDRHNKRAFKAGWHDALRAKRGEGKPYNNPEKNTWQATGYRFGSTFGLTDEDEINRAWEWSIQELRRADYVDVKRFERG